LFGKCSPSNVALQYKKILKEIQSINYIILTHRGIAGTNLDTQCGGSLAILCKLIWVILQARKIWWYWYLENRRIIPEPWEQDKANPHHFITLSDQIILDKSKWNQSIYFEAYNLIKYELIIN
jgi:hypothetical protein